MTRISLVVVAAVLFLPCSASSHVEVTPKRAAAGGEARLTLVVENERPTSATRRIDVQLPSGVTSATGRNLRGWKLRVRSAQGAPPRMILTAPRGKELTGHQAGRFRLVVGLPPDAGKRIAFKVLQTYDNGEVVRWIGPPDAGDPAPTLRLTAAKEVAPEEPATGADERPEPAPASSNDDASGSKDDDSSLVPIVVGVCAIVLILVAGITLSRRRKTRQNRTPT